MTAALSHDSARPAYSARLGVSPYVLTRDYISSTIPLLWPSPSLLSFRFDIHRNLRSLSFDHCFVPAVTRSKSSTNIISLLSALSITK